MQVFASIDHWAQSPLMMNSEVKAGTNQRSLVRAVHRDRILIYRVAVSTPPHLSSLLFFFWLLVVKTFFIFLSFSYLFSLYISRI